MVALCLANHPPAWDALIGRYAALLFTTARRLGLPDADAEDVVQEVSILLYEHLADLRETTRLPHWLITTTRRAAWKRFRRENIPPFSEAVSEEWLLESAIPVGKESGGTPEEILLEMERAWEIRVGMERLSPTCQRLLHLLYVQEPPASYADAAHQLQIPLNSVSPNRSRCLQRLKEILEKSED
ncbi:MAG: sigma-70 family RNA polymerase sigma factor [Capsulimonadales bacterium]|nr:sigma-70 family RNA polymerase sigma factor [Capsulimonadales bacterium]